VSAIASFYAFPETMMPELFEAAAVPPRLAPTFTERVRLLFSGRKDAYPKDAYWELLRARAAEQDEYPWSGWSFTHLELVLPEGASLPDGGRADPDAARLGALRETTVLFDHDGAQWLLERLRPVVLRPEAVLDEIPDELGGDLDAARAVVEALEVARRWLAAVRPGTLGLLSVG
jgi:hypothetical protein